MSKEEDWQDLWAHTETAFGGKVSLLVNNAGVNPQHGWKASINIMLTGVGYGTFLALEKMGTSKVCLISITYVCLTLSSMKARKMLIFREPPKGNSMSWAGCQNNPIDVNFYLQKSLEFIEKNQLTKSDSKRPGG